MKLHIKESVNLMTDIIYDNIALLGYACVLGANDFHHIHLCSIGDKFTEQHGKAEHYMYQLRELADFCLELAIEGGITPYNETHAYEVIKDSGNDWKIAESDSYTFNEFLTESCNILEDIVKFITVITNFDGVTSDVASKLDDYCRQFSKEVNYFMTKQKDSSLIDLSKDSNDSDDSLDIDIDLDTDSYDDLQ